MKTILTKTIATVLIITLGQSADVKADQTDQVGMMVDMSINRMNRAGDLSKISECLSVSESTFVSAFKKTMCHCINKYGFEESSQDVFGNCFKTQTKSNLLVSNSQFENFSDKFPDETDSETEITEQDYLELSNEDFKLVMEQQQAEVMERMDNLVDMSKAMSKGTEGLVTLPIYPTSSVVSHYTNGMTKNNGQQTLPVATFHSPDRVAKIIQFYRKPLPAFKIHEEDELFTMIQNIPANLLAMSLDLENLLLYSFPHIAVYSLNINGQQKTTIMITYEK